MEGPRCPRCGAIYAKAAALRAGERLGAVPRPAAPDAPPLAPVPPAPAPSAAAAAWRLEYLLRLWAPPAALALALLMVRSPLGHLLQRIFLSMMAHEVGHALGAWLSGFPSLPTVWVTYTAPTRSAGAALLIALGLAGLVGWAVWRRRPGPAVAGAVLLAVQLLCTLGVGAEGARCFITFAGDGGAMVLGAALMASFFVAPGSRLQRGGLRWGLLVIGAAALVDPLSTWWAARRDLDVIPFGVQEGVGLSDPSRLVQVCHWPTSLMVQRYVWLGTLCLAALALAWGHAVWAARRAGPRAGRGE